MKPVVHHAFAILAGFLAIIVGGVLIDFLGLWLYPLPPGMRLGTTPMTEIMASRPQAAVLFYNVLRLPVVVLGAAAAARIAPSRPQPAALMAVLLYVALSIAATVSAGSSTWALVWIIGMFPVCGVIGASLVTKWQRRTGV